MMKRLTKNMLLLGLLWSCLCNLQSCRKQAPVAQGVSPVPHTKRTTTTAGQVVNGLLVFPDENALHEKISALANLTEAELDAYNRNQAAYTSLYRQYQLMDEAAENETGISASEAISRKEIAFIPDDYLASLVNKDGLLAVGNQVFKYNTDDWQACSIEHLNSINTYAWANEPKQSYKKESPNYGNPEWASFPPVSTMLEVDDNGNPWPESNGRRVRAVHTTWCSWFGVYGSAGSKVKMEKLSKFAGWVNIDHSSATNQCSSYFRYYTFLTSSAGSLWAWDYYTRSENKNTSNKHVNEIVLTYRASILAGPLQHMVNNFISDVSITYAGHTRHNTWIH